MNNLERARCIVKEFNKNYKPQPCCCLNNTNTTSNVTLTIGTVTTGDAGSDAEASITGTSPNFILNLTIPQGVTGPTGPTGDAGTAATITVGTTTTGDPGTEASVTNSGTTEDAILDFTIPQGPTGPTGPTGPSS